MRATTAAIAARASDTSSRSPLGARELTEHPPPSLSSLEGGGGTHRAEGRSQRKPLAQSVLDTQVVRQAPNAGSQV